MLVCPNCQFENPRSNRFCQQCGTSLTDRLCGGCGAVVPLDVEHCLHCGTPTGTVWRLILIQPKQASFLPSPIDSLPIDSLPADPPTKETPPKAPAQTAPAQTATLQPGDYLDTQHRYRLLELPLEASPGLELTLAPALCSSAKVLDCQPFALTVLSAMPVIPAMPVMRVDRPLPHPPAVPPVAYAPVQPSLEYGAQASPLIFLQPYLALQGFDPAIPKIHDAWIDIGQDSAKGSDRTIILIEDRSDWQSLLRGWVEEAVQPLQLLSWMQHMTRLWAELERYQACQSLLILDNLRLDPQGNLGLQHLYFGNLAAVNDGFTKAASGDLAADRQLPLTALGQIWYQLFQASQRTQIAEFILLCHDLIGGTIISWDDLRSRLDAIGPTAELTSDSSTTMTSDKPKPRNPAAAVPVPPPPPPLTVGNGGVTNPIASPLSGDLPSPISSDMPSDIPSDMPSDMPSDSPMLGSYPDFGDDDSPSEGDDLPTAILPMRLSTLDDAGRTDVGRQRDHNEDCYTIQTEIKKLESPKERLLQIKGLYILCDGMGGHAGGEVASALAVDSLRQYFHHHWQDKLPDETLIKTAILQANQVLFEQNQKNASSGSGRMGTTLALMLVHNSEVAIAHVGDSRIYRYTRRLGLEQLTTDHEVGQREIQRGVDAETAYGRPDAYQLTQALGPRNEHFINPEVQFLELNEDQLILLCSDGLTDNGLLEFYWESHLDPLLSSRASLEQGVISLIELANQHNGHDNITVVAVRAKVQPYINGIAVG